MTFIFTLGWFDQTIIRPVSQVGTSFQYWRDIFAVAWLLPKDEVTGDSLKR